MWRWCATCSCMGLTWAIPWSRGTSIAPCRLLYLKKWQHKAMRFQSAPKGPKIEKIQDRPPGLKFSIEIENFKRATRQTPIFCGEFWRSGLKFSIEIEIFKRDWNFQSRLNFFNLWALRGMRFATLLRKTREGWNCRFQKTHPARKVGTRSRQCRPKGSRQVCLSRCPKSQNL